VAALRKLNKRSKIPASVIAREGIDLIIKKYHAKKGT